LHKHTYQKKSSYEQSYFGLLLTNNMLGGWALYTYTVHTTHKLLHTAQYEWPNPSATRI